MRAPTPRVNEVQRPFRRGRVRPRGLPRP
jgi:hypothetical protein